MTGRKCGFIQTEKLKYQYNMQPIEYQTQSVPERKSVVVKIASGLAGLDKKKFPTIHSLIHHSNTKKAAVLESLIEQMYASDFDLEKSLLAIEENS